MSFFSRKVQLYNSRYKPSKRLKLGNNIVPEEQLPQYELQRRAMEKIYSGGKNSGKNFGIGVGP